MNETLDGALIGNGFINVVAAKLYQKKEKVYNI